MNVALYYPLTEGGVSRRISEIQTRSKYNVKIIRDAKELEDFDIIHSYADAYVGDIHTCATYLRQAQDFLNRRSRHFFKFLPKGINELYQLKKFDVIISRSKAEQGWLKKQGIKSKLITAGVDHDTFRPPRIQELSKENAEKIVVFVGRLEKAKGVHLVSEAMSHLPKEYTAYVIGDGKMKPYVEAHPRLEYIGTVSHERIPFFMQQADVFCLPSYTECFPLSVLEAMACDVPVIATDVGDIKEMIQPPKGGYLCSYSPKDIAKKILLATENRDTFTARELSLRYTWQSTTNKVEKIWETKMDA